MMCKDMIGGNAYYSGTVAVGFDSDQFDYPEYQLYVRSLLQYVRNLFHIEYLKGLKFVIMRRV